jgi:hypothetical protein
MEGILCILGVGLPLVCIVSTGIIGGTIYGIVQQRRDLGDLREHLQQRGFVPVPSSTWSLGEVDGTPVAAKLRPGASAGQAGVKGDGRVFVVAEAVVPVHMASLGGRVARKGKRGPDGPALSDHFYGELGGQLEHVPRPAADALVDWARACPGDDLMLCDREHRWSFAAEAFPRAVVLLRVQRELREADALDGFLAEVVARSAPMSPPDDLGTRGR